MKNVNLRALAPISKTEDLRLVKLCNESMEKVVFESRSAKFSATWIKLVEKSYAKFKKVKPPPWAHIH